MYLDWAESCIVSHHVDIVKLHYERQRNTTRRRFLHNIVNWSFSPHYTLAKQMVRTKHWCKCTRLLLLQLHHQLQLFSTYLFTLTICQLTGKVNCFANSKCQQLLPLISIHTLYLKLSTGFSFRVVHGEYLSNNHSRQLVKNA